MDFFVLCPTSPRVPGTGVYMFSLIPASFYRRLFSPCANHTTPDRAQAGRAADPTATIRLTYLTSFQLRAVVNVADDFDVS